MQPNWTRIAEETFAMVKRTSFETNDCPIARSLEAIGDWWSLLIVRDAFLGAKRFGDFQKSLGVAKNILAVRLRALAAHGVLKMQPAAAGGRHEYVLTEKGRALFTAMVALRQWGETYCFGADGCRIALLDREQGRPVARLELHAEDGRRLEPADTVVTRRARGTLSP
jgi:DNA-binding HxlR family transcriptional regulator